MSTPNESEPSKQTPDEIRAAQLKATEEHSAAAQAAAARATEAQEGAQAAASHAAEARVAAQAAATEAKAAAAQTPELKPEPKLRHEFVGMMFALAIGEVGVQTAALVQAHNWVHFLPAYSHLFLAAVVIATSWVGWTLSPAPGARQDVRSVLEWEFLVLLIDVFLVVVYFILAKTVDFGEERPIHLNASARPETLWILVIFGVYCLWDVITKVAVYLKERQRLSLLEWFKKFGVRMLPTIICFVILIYAKPVFDRADPPHVLTADLALLSIVLLFRALKGLTQLATEPNMTKKWLIIWTLLCLLGLGVGTKWTYSSWPIFKTIADQIQTIPAEQSSHSEPPKTPAISTQESLKPDRTKGPE